MQPIAYIYTHHKTEATTGYFSCDPENMDFGSDVASSPAMTRLEACPTDTFLHDALLRAILSLAPEDLEALWPEPWTRRPVLAALVASAVLIRPASGSGAAPQTLHAKLTRDVLIALTARSGLPLPVWGLRPQREALRYWNSVFAANIANHSVLPHPDDDEPPLPAVLRLTHAQPATAISLAALHAKFTPPPTEAPIPSHETAALALERLMDIDAIASMEMRHTGSLAPVGLLRHWHVDIRVHCGRVRHTLTGQGTSWGRGFCVADARASYAMEMIERLSAYVSVEANEVLNRLTPMPLTRARFSQLEHALDPNTLPLGLSYHDQPLYWVEGHDVYGDAILLPLQAAALFCNLDEPNLLLAPVSTGLASGNTLEQAKRAALLELIERDAEATTPYTGLGSARQSSALFTLTTEDPHLGSLLEAYAQAGIAVQFRRLENSFGVPCFECFVRGSDGTVVRATAAGLSAKQAIVAALTETPWPFPGGSASAPAFAGLAVQRYEDLPDYSTGSFAGDTSLLEELLAEHNCAPVYVTLTRKDLLFPVVRAFVSGLERTADPDPWALPPKRFVQRYVQLYGETL